MDPLKGYLSDSATKPMFGQLSTTVIIPDPQTYEEPNDAGGTTIWIGEMPDQKGG